MPSLFARDLSVMRKSWSRGTEGQDSRSVERFIIGSLVWDDWLPSYLRNIFCDHRSLCLRAKGGVVIQSGYWEKKTPTLLSVLVVLMVHAERSLFDICLSLARIGMNTWTQAA